MPVKMPNKKCKRYKLVAGSWMPSASLDQQPKANVNASANALVMAKVVKMRVMEMSVVVLWMRADAVEANAPNGPGRGRREIFRTSADFRHRPRRGGYNCQRAAGG